MSADGYTRITLRIPDGLHAKLTSEAARTSKSMNAEIVARLETTFEEQAKLDPAAINARNEDILQCIERFSSLQTTMLDVLQRLQSFNQPTDAPHSLTGKPKPSKP